MTQATVLLEGPVFPHHLPFLVAREEELFEDQTIEIETPEELDGDLSPLTGGDVEYALSHPLNLVAECLSGKDMLGIARYFHTDSGVAYRPGAGLESPSDLADDNTIGHLNVGSELAEPIIRQMIKKDGGDPPASFDFEVIRRDPVAAMKAGDVDVLIPAWIVPNGVRMQIEGVEAEFWHFDEFDIPANGDLSLLTSRENAEANPNKILNFVHGLHKGLKKTKQDSEKALEIYEDHCPDRAGDPATKALLQTSIDGFTEVFSQDYATFSSWSEYLQDEGDFEGLIDLNRLVDERFLPVDAMSF
jgi:putative hydroxymethylpyrimidine transport system substrate-binding protein